MKKVTHASYFASILFKKWNDNKYSGGNLNYLCVLQHYRCNNGKPFFCCQNWVEMEFKLNGYCKIFFYFDLSHSIFFLLEHRQLLIGISYFMVIFYTT